jgi:hypothetical protein
MKTRILLLTLLTGAVVFWSGCTDLKDGLPAASAPGVQVHQPSWNDTTSGNFHGLYVKDKLHGDLQSCLTCHGQDYNGGSSKVSCVTCHQATSGTIHGKGWEVPGSPNFHGKAIAAASWDMRPCQTCHGQVYAGGRVPSSCRDCHVSAGGPENCATCHGTSSPAPPRDLSGNTARSAPGVGAHQRHLTGGGATTSNTLRCGVCHHVPGATYEPGHVDTPGPAEVVLSGGIALADPTVPTPTPTYNASTLTCSNTFCHGNWSLRRAESPNGNDFWYTDSVMTGSNRPVSWTAGAAEVACGTCHGLPPAGHVSSPSILRCGNCHIGIVGSDGVTITDKSRHMNGMIDVFFDPPRSF